MTIEPSITISVVCLIIPNCDGQLLYWTIHKGFSRVEQSKTDGGKAGHVVVVSYRMINRFCVTASTGKWNCTKLATNAKTCALSGPSDQSVFSQTSNWSESLFHQKASFWIKKNRDG